MQGFYPNDRMAYPLYEAINDGGAIALFHTGQTGVGSGMPGGMGMRLKYSNPMYMDDVAADFPDLKIILAHPSFPWQEEALSVATHKPNVYIDLSGWSPKYFPPILVRYINSILQDKMLFGSDWPVITPDRWLADFAKLDIRDEIRPKVLKANARKNVRHLTRADSPSWGNALNQSESVPSFAETAASGEIAEIYADIRATLGTSVVNLIWRNLATMPGALQWTWSTVRPLYVGPAAPHAEAVRRTLRCRACRRFRRRLPRRESTDSAAERKSAPY